MKVIALAVLLAGTAATGMPQKEKEELQQADTAFKTQTVLYPNNVPRVQECSERSGRSERSERAEQCSERSRTWWPRWAVGRGICGQDQHADLGYIS